MNAEIIKQARVIASRGSMDDVDVQIIFDLADYAARLEGTLVQKDMVIHRQELAFNRCMADRVAQQVKIEQLCDALTQQRRKYGKLFRFTKQQRQHLERIIAEQADANRRLRGRLSEKDPSTQSIPRPNDSIRARLLTPEEDARLTADLARIAETRMVKYGRCSYGHPHCDGMCNPY